jgi:hypothetical protein
LAEKSLTGDVAAVDAAHMERDHLEEALVDIVAEDLGSRILAAAAVVDLVLRTYGVGRAQMKTRQKLGSWTGECGRRSEGMVESSALPP